MIIAVEQFRFPVWNPCSTLCSMKPTLICLFIGCTICLNLLSAQSVFGFRAGGISSTLKSKETFLIDGVDWLSILPDLLSVQAGFGLSRPIGTQFDIDTDCTFSIRGYRFFNADKNSLHGNGKFEFFYLNLPVNLHYRPNEGKLGVVIGLQLSYLLGDRFTSSKPPPNIDWQWKPFDFNLEFGFSFRLREDLKFFFGGQFGLFPINDFQLFDANGEQAGDLQLRSRVYHLSVYHYLLP